MSNSTRRFNTLVYEEAADWFMEFRSGEVGLNERRRFVEWLTISREHVQAYIELAAIWNEGHHLDPDRQIDENELVQRALRDINVVPLHVDPAWLPRDVVRPRDDRLQPLRWALALSACLTLAAAGLGLWVHAQQGVYSTDIGE